MTEHQEVVSDELLEKQADYIYDQIRINIFREEWRELYKTLMNNEPKDILKFFAELNTPPSDEYPSYAYGYKALGEPIVPAPEFFARAMHERHGDKLMRRGRADWEEVKTYPNPDKEDDGIGLNGGAPRW